MGVTRYIEKHCLGLVLNNKSFKDLTTMKVGGRIKNLYYPNSTESLLKVIKYLNIRKKGYLLIGNGSNIIASDHKYKKFVISGKHLEKDIIFQDNYFIVSAFADLRRINAKLIEKKISTFVNLTGIPGTLGGAIYMNAGAYKSNISDNLLWVKCIENGCLVIKYLEDIDFGYRNSYFKNKNIIILEAAFKIILDNEVILKHQEIINKRNERHPLNYPNSGSIFKNGMNYSAYQIIKKINLVNYYIGGATFSDKHSNFIVNKNKAKAKDIYKLIILAKKRAVVYENIYLKEEVILLNFYTYPFFKIIFKKAK